MGQKSEKVIDVFIMDYNPSVRDFLYGAKKPETQYNDCDVSFIQHSPKGKEEIQLSISGEDILKRKQISRFEYVDQYRGSKSVDFDNLEKMLSYENEIISIDFDFNIGSLKNLYQTQYEIQRYVYYYLCDTADEAADEAREYVSDVSKNIEKIETKARSGAIIRVWNATQSNDVLGFSFLVNKLDNVECDIINVTLPYEYTTPRGEKKNAGRWGFVSAEEICAPFSHAQKLSGEERRIISERWRKFVEENAKLRTLVDGEVQSVTSDYFRDFILAHIPEGEFETISVVGELLRDAEEYFPDYYWTKEISKLIEEGVLKRLGPGMNWGRDNCRAIRITK